MCLWFRDDGGVRVLLVVVRVLRTTTAPLSVAPNKRGGIARDEREATRPADHHSLKKSGSAIYGVGMHSIVWFSRELSHKNKTNK